MHARRCFGAQRLQQGAVSGGGQHHAGQGGYSRRQLPDAFFGDHAAEKDHQLFAVRAEGGAGQFRRLGRGQLGGQGVGVDGVGHGAAGVNAKGFQPAAAGQRYTVKGRAGAADERAGGVLVHTAGQPDDAAAHGHVPGGMVDDHRGDAPARCRAGGPDALDIHAGLHHAQVDGLGKDPAFQRRKPAARL